MAENPLLPHAELRTLHRTLERLAALHTTGGAVRRSRTVLDEADALLAATVMQLREGDLVITGHHHGLLQEWLHSEPRQGDRPSLHSFAPSVPLLTAAAGLSAALRRSGSDRAVLAVTSSAEDVNSINSGWRVALPWAQAENLPLVIAVADPSGENVFRAPLDSTPDDLAWPAVQRLAAEVQFPILSVDGEDPVAVYRVMQESLLRARSSSGPAMLWAALPASSTGRKGKSPQASALARMQHYLQVRGIKVRTRNASFAVEPRRR